MRYVMVIDRGRCVGCDACAIACKQANATLPGMFWNHVEKAEEGTYPNARQVFTPVLCNHCANPACVEVCPAQATWQREDGIVVIDHEACIGCGACVAACPYEMRSLVPETIEGYYGEMGLCAFETARYPEHVPNTAEKCDFCAARLDEGKKPACVAACPARARVFGDADDPDGEVAQLLAAREATQLLPETGCDPQVFYV